MILIREITHEQQRYPTCGDWYLTPNNDLVINVSKTSDWKNSALVAVHELVEALLCRVRGIDEEDVTNHDIWFEDQHLLGEPGDHPSAPYLHEHRFATRVEKLLCEQFGLNWEEHEKVINSLFEEES